MDQQDHRIHSRCRNCAAELHGEYCSSCGQRDKDLHVPVKELVTEAADLIPAIDRRVLRSVLPLTFRPGTLTLTYLEGKRKQFVSPFKLYFAVSVLFFLVSSLSDDSDERRRSESLLTGESRSAYRGDSAFVSVGSPDNRFRITVKDSAEAAAVLGSGSVTLLQRLKENPDLMFTKIKEHRPKIIFLLLPFFALLLKLLYLRSGTLYIKHLVFSFYYHSFLFLVFLTIELVEFLPLPGTSIVAAILWMALPVNLFIGLKQAYGQGNRKTLLKLLLLIASYGLTFFVIMGVAALTIIYLFYR